MPESRVQGVSRTSITRNLICVALPLLMLGNCVTVARNSQQSAQLSVEDARPVAKALDMIETVCQCVITYEDPRYAHESEIKDVTNEVRRDLGNFEPGKAPRVLVPKGGVLTMNYSTVPGTSRPLNLVATLQQLLDTNEISGGAGRFRLEAQDNAIHIIPTAVKNASGRVASQQSILEAVISVPVKERSGAQTLMAICDAIGEENKVHVVAATFPLNLLNPHRSAEGFANQRARDVLFNFLRRVDKGGRLSWRLFYDPGTNTYYLNIHRIR